MLTLKFFNLRTYYLKMSRSVLGCWTSYGSDGFTCEVLRVITICPICVSLPLLVRIGSVYLALVKM